VLAIAIPSYQGYVHRSRITEVMDELGRVRALVSGDLVARKAGSPSKRDMKPESPMVTRIAVDYEARSISAFVNHESFNHPTVPAGRSIRYTAVMDGPNMDWKCTSDVPAKFLPAACR
jgi:Tfp pilus assembly major pilin PilA